MKKLFFLLLLLDLPLQAQEYTSRYFHYNQYYDAPAPFTIAATTIDGADSNAIILGGGGSAAGSRGAYLQLIGNENGSTGKVTIASGTVAGGDIQFYPGDYYGWTMPYTGSNATNTLVFGQSAVASSVATIRGARADGSDDGEICVTGGGACGGSRGALLELHGNEDGVAGDAYLNSGNAVGSDIFLQTGGGSRLTIPYLADADDVDLILGSVSTTAPIFTLRGQTADGDDDGQLDIASGGAAGSARGAFERMYGNEVAGVGGQHYMVAGNIATGDLFFQTGGGTRLTIPYQAAVNNVDLVLGITATTAPIFTIRAQTADGDDDGTLNLISGGASGSSRGGYVSLWGNEAASNGGRVSIQAGDSATHGGITFATNGGVIQWSIPRAGTVDHTLVFGAAAEAAAVATIRGARADGSDDGTLNLAAGGATGSDRGAYLTITGLEAGGGTGYLNYYVGNAATGLHRFYTGDSKLRLTIPYLADADDVDLILGSAATTAPVFTIRGQTADGDDDAQLLLGPGGAIANTRGGFVNLYGNEHATNAGDTIVSAGNVAGGDLVLQAVSGGIYFSPGGSDRWSVTNGGDFSQNATNGGNIVMAKASTGVIVGAASIHADVSGIGTPTYYSFGDYIDFARGVNDVYGTSVNFFKSRKTDGSADTIVQSGDTLGNLNFYGANGSGFDVAACITSAVDGTPGASDMPGRLEFLTTTDGSVTIRRRWYIDSAGTYIQDATYGGNITFQKDLTGIVDSTDAPAAAGSALADATALTAVVTFVTDADATKGVKFPAAPIGGQRYVIYNTANAVLKVYPGEAGDQINAAGAGTAVQVAAYSALYCHASSAAQIWCGEMANP